MKRILAKSRDNPDISSPAPSLAWKLLVVDDDPDVHTATRLSLSRFVFAHGPLQLIHAHSARAARALLTQHEDLAAALIDVMMETDTAGLELVEHIRNTLDNATIRIIIRTGQPGL
ncbi:MAG: hypothetical protein HQL95_15600, partial [Magnetococcales bacterium]|nr:hypothetical protein [Magnetococcales bacterium]